MNAHKGDAVRRVLRRSRRSIFQAFLESARRKGGKTLAVIDGDGRKLTYRDIVRGAFAISGPIARRTTKGESVGVLLPTGAGILIAFLAILARGRTPAMLNFTAGARNLKAACNAAEVRRVVTARKFVELAGLEKLIAELSEAVEFIYLEDAKEALTRADKLRALAGPLLPKLLAADPHPDDTGVILFTSGTEGDPKGVVLTHANILANIQQITEHVEIEPTDVFFNPLPAFHCYGLTAGTLWPVMAGYPVVLHPSPLQTKIIPKRIFETSATIILATDTFLNQYMRASEEGGMSSLRIAVCGAERVKDETRQAAERRFSFEVLEGYGVTEASPVVAANQPGDIRAGAVGRLLPGIEARVEPVEGLAEGGRLFIRGPNVMKGYLTPDEPGVVKPLADGWHDTGDVVAFDENGYMSIRGRLKRFAKIGGEMISLAVVENCACAVWPDHLHGAVALPDERKGEQIVLVTAKAGADRGLLLAWARSHGVPELAVPKKIVCVADVPVLGTGKLDYATIQRMAEEGLAALEAAAAEPAPAPTRRELKEAQKRQRAEEKRAAREERAQSAAASDARSDAPDEDPLPKAAE
ncbi:AMP-binding protein [Amphiplicatus metriothermophilus]|uniref:Acyl-[acyl-carrier-protein]-phospholipid O-acyltransferase / long-chain-fatty-acid--[acyl-carrier-protein] ligase n=1 Tax=Amphiplicatus metriothermophilus TaxID=1519374 RepID=A0A239PIN2_9PROT|nr:AMP-binding protein [Amphiplicatus metriothermophilus]MBB5517994.1 acyl-[acyl-carrier-protein]-phospholipid O-acyltransferase/long-chain-fatty-acid--[acyl-carrier-protein] ligase [Amphiplicatus metriothermophilus]SNT67672.1 acyl-[acyl-carrier-protein]-phospholipid O-acyltransferase / long-chain-fatty-acid--[acyl-carrier-protein] ligase [Amphiplicatus metriothermophilus]